MAIVEQDYEVKSSLKVKLDFKKYAEENNCHDELRNRLEILNYPMITPLSDYFGCEEYLEIRKRHHFDSNLYKDRKFSIKSSKRKMTLEIFVGSKNPLSKDELLNVENLDYFILTGEYPQKKVD